MSNKVAVVVGGGSGMGAAAARKLAQDGFQVAVLSSSGKGEALGRELGGIGLTGSNQSSEDLQKLVDQTMARWGRMLRSSSVGAQVWRHPIAFGVLQAASLAVPVQLAGA